MWKMQHYKITGKLGSKESTFQSNPDTTIPRNMTIQRYDFIDDVLCIPNDDLIDMETNQEDEAPHSEPAYNNEYQENIFLNNSSGRYNPTSVDFLG